MYYEERWLNERLYYKLSPEGEWMEFTLEMYANRVVEREKEVMKLQMELQELKE